MAGQSALFHETFSDALREIIDQLGGAKKVGLMMRPEKTMDHARTWLLDCLNPDREARFDPDQVLWLLKAGRRIGCHAGVRYLAREAGYAEPVPQDPADQVSHLVETIEGASDQLKQALLALERVQASGLYHPQRVGK